MTTTASGATATDDPDFNGREGLVAALSAAGMVAWDWDPAAGRVRLSGDTGGWTEQPIDDFWRRVDPDDRDRVRRAVDAALAGGEPYRVEYRINALAGGLRWVVSKGRLIVARGGAPARLVGVTTDVTELKRVEHELRVRERARAAELEVVMDAVPAVVWIAHDAACGRITGNRAASELLRLPRGSNISLTAPEGERPTNFRAYRDGVEIPPEELPMQAAAARGVELRGFEERLVFDDGTVRDLIGNAAPLFDDAGAVRGAVATFIDVTGLKAAEAALRDADRRKDEFLAVLAHELRNPLAAIDGVVGLWRGGGPVSDADLEWARGALDRQVKQLTRLVDDLLDVSRITLGKIRLRPEPLDAAAAVARAVESALPQADARRQRLSASYGPGPFPIVADPTRIEQVVVNLLNNAVKYTEVGGSVVVTVVRDDPDVSITVRDNGHGIAPALLPRVFEPFIQDDASPGRSRDGLGIGLTLVRSLVALHGGSVTAASPGVGLGSSFTVRLPLAPDAAPVSTTPDPQPVPHPPAAPRPAGGRALIVDDNVDAAHGLSRLLTALGYDVEVVHDGPDALAAAAARPPDVVLLDIGLPGMDGYEVASRLRTDLGLAAALVVVVSGYGQERDRTLSTSVGVDHHLVKPVDSAALRALLPRRG